MQTSAASLRLSWSLPEALATAGPPLLFALRLWASVCLALFFAFWLQLDNPYWAGGSAAIVCQPQLGASLRKGWFRMIGTVLGAAMAVVLTMLSTGSRGLSRIARAMGRPLRICRHRIPQFRVRGDAGFIDKNQPLRIKPWLLLLQRLACGGEPSVDLTLEQLRIFEQAYDLCPHDLVEKVLAHRPIVTNKLAKVPIGVGAEATVIVDLAGA
jgi:hypothetical protein